MTAMPRTPSSPGAWGTPAVGQAGRTRRGPTRTATGTPPFRPWRSGSHGPVEESANHAERFIRLGGSYGEKWRGFSERGPDHGRDLALARAVGRDDDVDRASRAGDGGAQPDLEVQREARAAEAGSRDAAVEGVLKPHACPPVDLRADELDVVARFEHRLVRHAAVFEER